VSVQDDLVTLLKAQQLATGRRPQSIRIGRHVAEALADELWREQSALFTGPRFSRQYAMDSLLAGEMRFMGIPLTVDDTFPSQTQADAIEGYRQVGPC